MVQVNTEENPRLASRFVVTGIPVLFLLKKGKVVGTLSGAQPIDEIVSWFRRHEAG